MSILYGLFGSSAFYVMLAFQVLCGVHCFRTGRNRAWLIPIILFPALGCLLYFFVEVLPNARRSRQLDRLIDPNRDLREGSVNFAISNNVDTTRQYADELIRRGKYQEAATLYENARKGIFVNDPVILLGLASAYFGLKRYADCIRVVDELMQHHPKERTPDAHLIYARALEHENRIDEALKAYQLLAGSYPGPEAKCRYALLLKKRGEAQQAHELFREVVLQASTAPAHYQRLHREWINTARNEARAVAVN